MVNPWASSLRHTLLRRTCARTIRAPQRRWARVHDVRFLTTNPSSDRAYEKYREKLDRKAKEVGAKDLNELKKVYSGRIEQTRRETHDPLSQIPFNPPPPPSPVSPAESTTSASTDTISSSSNSTPSDFTPPSTSKPAIKTLSSFLDLSKVSALPPKEIEALWRLRHAASPTTLCASIPTSVFKKISEVAKKHPQFILPLPKSSSPSSSTSSSTPATESDIHFLQWTHPSPTTITVLFTTLAEYKLRGEYAVPHTTVTHHLELAEEKDLVLLQGTVAEGRGVNVEEARWLLMNLQKFYGMADGSGKRARLLKMFSEGDEGFSVDELVEEVGKVD